ncbi:MAG: hypothetical protein HOV81_35515 [Kofleriaceae bacterium]|nr:hypothetical protein [Kofleriaceae bacterium]
MKYAPLLLLVLAACPGDDGGEGNAQTLWLAPDKMETQVKLVEDRPPPF